MQGNWSNMDMEFMEELVRAVQEFVHYQVAFVEDDRDCMGEPQVNDIRRRMRIFHSLPMPIPAEPTMDTVTNYVKTLQKVVDSRGLGRRRLGNDPCGVGNNFFCQSNSAFYANLF